jgi:3-isopropylmalate/(R)-2-methylmalate dehydratase small subunit
VEPFGKYCSGVIPLDRTNVDTDAIIPKQFLKSVERSGFGDNLFDTWRYLDQGEPGQDCSARPVAPGFVLNQKRYRDARILLARDNFGCGSSREHAVWALRDYGIRTVIAPSFADIFFNNCFKNGLLPVSLPVADIDRLFDLAQGDDGLNLEVDLERQTLTTGEGRVYRFELDEFKQHCLIEGLDDIALTLRYESDILAYEESRRAQMPWLFEDIT